jgi:hypothetical protein
MVFAGIATVPFPATKYNCPLTSLAAFAALVLPVLLSVMIAGYPFGAVSEAT